MFANLQATEPAKYLISQGLLTAGKPGGADSPALGLRVAAE
jgi:hypothetical protein